MNSSHQQQLKEQGYTVIEEVLSQEEIQQGIALFNQWKPSGKVAHIHGIYKQHKAGQSDFAWFTRTRLKVVQSFSFLWGTDQLLTSFDGCANITANQKHRPSWWVHSDQSDTGFKCVQGLVTYTTNQEMTFNCIPGSHLKSLPIASKIRNFIKIPHSEELSAQLIKVPIKKGCLLLWDSRLWHQNSAHHSEERLVQYVCMLPKKNCPIRMQAKRIKYFQEGRTTSHWPYPIRVNGLQPQTYGDKELLIDYSTLPPQPSPAFYQANKQAIDNLV